MKHPQRISLLLAAALVVAATGCGGGNGQAADDLATARPTSAPATSATKDQTSAKPTAAPTTAASSPTPAVKPVVATSAPAKPTETVAKQLSYKQVKKLLVGLDLGADTPEVLQGLPAVAFTEMYPEVLSVKPKKCGVLLDFLAAAEPTTGFSVVAWEEAVVAVHQHKASSAKTYLKARDTAVSNCRSADLVVMDESVPVTVSSHPVSLPGASQALLVIMTGDGQMGQINMITFRIGGTLVFLQNYENSDQPKDLMKAARTMVTALTP